MYQISSATKIALVNLLTKYFYRMRLFQHIRHIFENDKKEFKLAKNIGMIIAYK